MQYEFMIRFSNLISQTCKVLPILIYFCATFSAKAHGSEIVTDRPDQTESSSAVSSGVTQIEFGWSHSYQKNGEIRERVNEFPQSLIRIGLKPGFELRLGWDGYVLKNPGVVSGDSFDGAGDMSMGIKINLRKSQGAAPEIALLVDATLPVGHSSFSSNRVDPSVRFSFSNSLSDRFSVGYNIGVTSSSEENNLGNVATAVSGLYTLALGTDISARFGAFVEVFGEKRIDLDEAPTHSLDGGVTRLFGDNIQLDVAVGLGLSSGAPDWFVTSGLSIRLPQ